MCSIRKTLKRWVCEFSQMVGHGASVSAHMFMLKRVQLGIQAKRYMTKSMFLFGPKTKTWEMSQIFNQLFLISKLLVAVLGPVSVEEPVIVEDAASASFARYGMKIKILKCLGF